MLVCAGPHQVPRDPAPVPRHRYRVRAVRHPQARHVRHRLPHRGRLLRHRLLRVHVRGHGHHHRGNHYHHNYHHYHYHTHYYDRCAYDYHCCNYNYNYTYICKEKAQWSLNNLYIEGII